MKLTDFSKDQLQWMLNKAYEGITDINNFIVTVHQHEMERVMEEEIENRITKREELVEIMAQVKKAIGDKAVSEMINSN